MRREPQNLWSLSVQRTISLKICNTTNLPEVTSCSHGAAFADACWQGPSVQNNPEMGKIVSKESFKIHNDHTHNWNHPVGEAEFVSKFVSANHESKSYFLSSELQLRAESPVALDKAKYLLNHLPCNPAQCSSHSIILNWLASPWGSLYTPAKNALATKAMWPYKYHTTVFEIHPSKYKWGYSICCSLTM